MKKLVTFSFVLFFTILSMLYFYNFAFNSIDQIEGDKISLIIEKPKDISNIDFIADINNITEKLNVDIMLRRVENKSGKPHYQYFKTSNTNDFLKIKSSKNNTNLKNDECISTTNVSKLQVYHLNSSNLLQNISIYPLINSKAYDISAATYYLKKASQENIVNSLMQLGYIVKVNPTPYISGKFSVLLFCFVPAFMFIVSMIFYVLSSGKKNVLKKIEGYSTINIIYDEVKTMSKNFSITFLTIEFISIVIALFIYKDVVFEYVLFSIQNIAILIFITILAFLISSFLILKQNSIEYIKGRVPKKGIYITSIITKCIFVVFIIFLLSIAIRNATISYNTIQSSQFVADKTYGYVTIPVNTSNSSTENLSENYKKFYLSTVNRYNGILIDASNYEYNLINGNTPAEEFGQTYITINRNYLNFNPIYGLDSKKISDKQLSSNKFNVLIPISKHSEKEKWRKFVNDAYAMEVNFIQYDGKNSKIYSYNANTGSGNYGVIDEPIILVIEEDQLEGIFVLSYCSKGSYFLNVPTKNPYSTLYPVLQESGISSVTFETPSVSSSFSESINHQQQMLILYGTQSLLLIIGLLCLIIFSSKLYCENYKNKIASYLIEGYSVLYCIRMHLVFTIIYYLAVIVCLQFASIKMQISLNYFILIQSFIIELIISLIISSRYAKMNLYQITKGAE